MENQKLPSNADVHDAQEEEKLMAALAVDHADRLAATAEDVAE